MTVIGHWLHVLCITICLLMSARSVSGLAAVTLFALTVFFSVLLLTYLALLNGMLHLACLFATVKQLDAVHVVVPCQLQAAVLEILYAFHHCAVHPLSTLVKAGVRGTWESFWPCNQGLAWCLKYYRVHGCFFQLVLIWVFVFCGLVVLQAEQLAAAIVESIRWERIAVGTEEDHDAVWSPWPTKTGFLIAANR